MGKITKALQPKHKETLSPWLQEFVDSATSKPLPHLPQTLATFPSRWPFPRGDLYHWIPLLNRFDEILETFCQTYSLNHGPQTRDFGCETLLHLWADGSANIQKLSELGYNSDGDVTLIESILKFTQMLLDHCGNRSIYLSSSHLNDLLNSTDFRIICATLEVGVELAQRYQASVKRMHGAATRQMYTALLSNHYNIDLDRVHQLAQPFMKTPIVKLSESSSLATSSNSGKGKERLTGASPKNVASMFANDLCAIARPQPIESQSSESQWSGWADVKLTYYPSSSSSVSQEPSQSLLPDRAMPNAPSTPTPLRRSNTAQSSSTPTRPNRQIQEGIDDSPALGTRPTVARDDHGQRSLELSKSIVIRSSIYQLLAKAPEDLPKETRYEFLNRLRVAKALTGSVASRQQALKARLLAIQNLAYIHWEGTFIEKALGQDSDEPRRFQLVYQLAELIHPDADGTMCVPLDLQSIALALLEAIANFPQKVPDIFSALNATVNHGVLLYVIRKAVSEMKANDVGDQWTANDEWREKLFSLTLHITMTMANTSVRQTPEIISAGLLEVLVEILNIRSGIAERHYGTLIGFLDSLVYHVQTSFQALANADGLDAITNLITHEVHLAKQLVSEGKGTSSSLRSQVVDYKIPFYQQHNLKFLLKFIHHLMTNGYSFGGNTDRLLRNLVDKSDLLRSIREIIENVAQFGSLVWTNAVTILSDFLNNDPTSFSAIVEAGLVQSYLTALTGRPISFGQPAEGTVSQTENDPDSSASSPIADILEPDERAHPPTEDILEKPRDHPLAGGILASMEPISTVPTVLNAISLNNQGMKMVVSAQAFDSFFEIFESPDHVQVMTVEDSLAHSLGSSFDELARHHPTLRTAIANAVLDMIARVRHLGLTKARDDKWGTKLIPSDLGGQDLVAGASLSSSLQGKGSADAAKENSDIHMTDADAHNNHDVERDSLPAYTSFCPYINAVAEFLSAYIHNVNLKNSLISNGGIELLLDIYTSPSLPYDFGKSNAAKCLQDVLGSLIENSPIIGLPSLLRRMQTSLDLLDIVVKAQDTNGFFEPFLATDLVSAAKNTPALADQLTQGTSVVKALLNAQSLMKVLCRSFPFSSRAQTYILPAVNVFDYHAKFIKSLGPLLRAVVLEETAMSAVVPHQWYSKDNASYESTTGNKGSPPASEEDGLVRDLESASLFDVLSSASIWKLVTDSSSQDQKPPQVERSSPRYQNFQTIKVLFQSLLPTALPLLQGYGRSLLHRRERDLYTRSHHLQLAESLTLTILDQLSIPDHEITTKDYHYWFIMLHAIHDLLVNRIADSRGERQLPAQIMIPVLLAFKKHGGMALLNSMLIELKNEICKEHKTEDEVSKSTLAALCMKKILDLYIMITNGKIITEAVGQVNILPHRVSGSDRRPDSQIAPNLVVEIRATLLPVIQQLWESPLIERGSATIVTKTIEILKLISSADCEGSAYKRSDKTPPVGYLELDTVKFPWSTHAEDVQQMLQSHSYPEDLVQEAIYRSLGNYQTASEYCKAHGKGIAGPRNPIPEEDTPETSDMGTSVDDRDATVDEDSMVLDLPSDLPPGILDEELIGSLRDTSATSSGNDRIAPIPGSRNQPSNDHISQSTSPTHSAMMGAKSDDEVVAAPQMIAKEDLDEQRSKLRSNLIDRCLDVIGSHPDSTYEVAELISSILLHSPGDDQSDQSSRQEIGDTLVNALLSFANDDDLKSNGRSIAAYAHLLSLLLQESAFFKASAGVLAASIGEFLRFLQVSGSSSPEEVSPWIPYILLVFEILLSDDEQIGEVKWKIPENDGDSVEPLEWSSRELNIKVADRGTLLDLILEILPRIGKDESLAISVLRILVILTRDRAVARQLGDKRNLQRLFVTAKQLSGIGSQRLNETRMSSYILTILRHIIEDEEVIKQIMRCEIRTYLDGSRNARPQEPSLYLKHFSHLVLRDARLFTEVSNEMMKLARWSPRDGNVARQQVVVLKEPSTIAQKDDVAPTVQATEELSIQDIKPSTEAEDKQTGDATKSFTQDAKRPVVENPDGVVHFLLCELLNYKEVDDKDGSQPNKDAKSTVDQASTSSNHATETENRPIESKEKKGKSSFKSDEHPIFIYRCFLLHCLTELLASYNRTKVEFINFKRNAPLFANTPVKPRSSVLNYLLNDLLYPSHLDPTSDTIVHKKKYATAIQTQQLLLALVSKTGEKWVGRNRDDYEYEDEPDLLFVRKFVLDTILKSYKDATTSTDPFDSRYTRMLALAEVMHLIVGDKDKDPSVPIRSSHDSLDRSQAQMRRLMYEKGYLAALTSSIADIDLAFPPVKRTIKYILRVLRVLTSTAIHLSHSNLISSAPAQESNEDELVSTSSLSDIEDDREETPDLYRNSALGMLEPGREAIDDLSDGSDEDEDDDTEMYEDDYDDEMDDIGYESGDREDDVSDHEDEELEGMGPIEGLPGEPHVLEIGMDEDEDEDEDDDEDDEDDEMDDGDDEEVSENDEESIDIDEVEDRIEFADGEGNALHDDEASDWESETDEAIDEGAEDIDYEGAAQNLDEADVHELDDVDGLGRFGNIMRVIGEASEFPPIDDLNNIEERYMEEAEDDIEIDDDEDEYAYEEDFPNDPPPRDIMAPSLGWDTLVLDHGPIFGSRRRHPHSDRNPVPLPFMMGHRDLQHFADSRTRGGNSRDTRASANESVVNPLLRRVNDISRDASPRPSLQYVRANGASHLGLPGSLFASNIGSPMGFLNDLVAQLPAVGRVAGNAAALHFTIGSRRLAEIPFPFNIQSREMRSDSRRDTVQEPIQSTSFNTESAITRWTDEIKMIFGPQHQEQAVKVLPALLSYLVPPAILQEKKLQAEEQRIAEAKQKKREEEEKKAKEAKDAEEKAAKELKEAEERERAAAAEAAAAAAAAEAQTMAESAHDEESHRAHSQSDTMEGIEQPSEVQEESAATNQQRSFTTIRGEQVDVTELGIDPDYLEALPEEFREEVIAQTVSSRRAEAREAPRGTGEQTTEVFQEFLDALPDELRQEIVQQERQEQRRRDRDEARRQATAAGQAAEAQDMDAASILLTFPPALREQVLMDQGAEILDSLPPEMAHQARRILREQQPSTHAQPPTGFTRAREIAHIAQTLGAAEGENKAPRKTVVQMLDKPGVATLLRLMFMNMKEYPIAIPLKHVFKDVCENRQTRVEVISTLLQILQDGATDLDAVERSFAHLSIKAKQPKDNKDPKTQTPQGLKRTFTNISNHHSAQPNSETSPVLIVQQCLDLLCYLANHNVHVPSLFLTEHDAVASTVKRSLSRKGKTKDNKAQKYAINSLLSLLDRDLVMESSAIMDSLSQLLSRVTYPLLALDRKKKEAEESIRQLEAELKGSNAPHGEANTQSEPTTQIEGEEPGTAVTTVSGEATGINQTHRQDYQGQDAAIGITEKEAEPSNGEGTSITESQALEKRQAALKRIRQLNPPAIPIPNLTLIINIFVARECSSKTFKETLSTIKNLSIMDGAMMIFGKELARQAELLSQKIVVHLDELLPHIQNAGSGTEIQGVALSKFSPGASDQNKLLRVLTALDHLFAQKKPNGAGELSAEERKDQTSKEDLLGILYRNATFNALWEKLSACLSAIRQRESLLNVATILLPLIEALMVVCKDSTQTETSASKGQGSKDMVLSSPQPEDRMADLFFTFTEDHRRILNELVRNNPSLMKGTFSHLVKNPKVLEFDNKRNWFNRSVHNKQQASHRPFPTLQLSVRREHVFHDSFKSLYFKSGDEMKFGKLNIRFHGEEGVDAGGVTREWFQVLARQMFDPNYVLFVPVSSDRTTFHPNKLSGINDEHLMFFKFIGRVIGKALYEGRLLDCYFSRAVYKRILGKPVSVKDMESFDPEYYKSLSWMLDNDITDIITETFSVEDDEFGVTKIEDLCEDGRNIAVTEENKHDYVRLVVEHRLLSSVKEQMENFLKGFHEIIPAELISIFNEQELELLISGLPDVDVDDWKSNTEYHNYSPSSPQIQWFWRALRSFDKEEVAKLLQFVTGTSKVPLNGFKELEGMNGVNRFNIHRDYGNKDRLPSSHTCFNQLDLPEYESYEMLRRQLLKAITTGGEYFGFA